MVLEKTLESPLDCKENQPVHPKGDQSWVFIGRTDVEAEAPVFWPPDVKSRLIWKDPDAGKEWGQEEKGMTEDEMVGWHHRHNGYGFWVDSRSWRWTGSPGLLQFMGPQRVRLDWVTELNWTVINKSWPNYYQITTDQILKTGWKSTSLLIFICCFISYPWSQTELVYCLFCMTSLPIFRVPTIFQHQACLPISPLS